MRPDAPVPAAQARRRVGEAAAWWMGLTLGATLAISALILSYLLRRGRRLRDRLPPPRDLRLPELDRTESGESPP